MFRLLLIAVIFSLGICAPNANDQEGRIIDGNIAQLRQFQYVVSIRRVGSLVHLGGGTLISPSWVLTARAVTSLFARPADLSVALGILNSANAVLAPGMLATAQEFRTNDEIVLVRIPVIACNAARFGVITPIFLDSRLQPNVVNALVAGWGPTSGGDPNTLLRFRVVDTVDTCANATTLCIAGALCSTDVGGPLVSTTGLIGVAVSASCNPTLNDAFARISFYHSWISANAL